MLLFLAIDEQSSECCSKPLPIVEHNGVRRVISNPGVFKALSPDTSQLNFACLRLSPFRRAGLTVALAAPKFPCRPLALGRSYEDT
jgi:hypothetical protein